ncbi:MAG: hypothetical protein JST80_08120 [Bdellovibrionales bacterium]|nr:hypothetical protein [Bdellovibrionales bacterium]
MLTAGAILIVPARAQTPVAADKGLTSKQISQKLAVAKKKYFTDPDLDQLYKTLNELSGIKNSTTWIKTHPNDPATLAFKEFQLSLIELAQADALMNKCTKGQAILERKADGILNKLAAANKGKSSLGVCSANDKKDALAELDPETAILYEDHKAADQVKINPAVNMPTSMMLGIDEKNIRNLVYNNSVQAHSDFLGTKNVYQDPKMREQFGKAQENELQTKVDNVKSHVKKTRAWIDAHESSAQTDEYVRKKYGFDIKDNEYSFEAIKRAKQLHQELMDGNRKNSLRNYLYFSQRFSFSGEPDLSGSDNYRGIESKALDMFGKAQHLTSSAHLTRNLPEYEEQELGRFGQGAIKDMQKAYVGHYRMGEDDVLKMLAPALKEAGVSVAADHMVLQELQNEKIDAHMDAGLTAPKQQLNRNAQMSIISGMTGKAIEAAKQKYMGTEVGFVLHTDAFKKYVASLSAGGKNADPKVMIRDAVKEMIKQTQDYAGWVDVNQSDKNFFADDKGVWDYSKAAELMMYSAPNTVQSIITKNPQLLGSMCYPMQQAAKKRDMSPPSWVVWGGGAMSAIPGPAGIAANRIFGAVSAGFVIAEHKEKASALHKQDKYTGLGDYILEKNRVEADEDKKELKSVVKAHEEEINGAIINVVATEVIGHGINRAVTKGVARKQASPEALGKDGKQMYVNPSNIETKVGKDGLFGTGKNTTIDAGSKTVPYNDMANVVTENGTVSRDLVGTAGEVKGSIEAPINRVVPDSRTQLGMYAKAMEKKGTTVYLQPDDPNFSSAGYSGEARVIGTSVSQQKGRVIALRENDDNFVFRQRIVRHEGFHNEVKVKIERGEDTPWGSSFKSVNGRKSLYAGPRETINIGYNTRLSPEEINTYGKDFMSSTVIAHNRETSHAIDQAIKKMPSSLSQEEKLARVKINYNTVIDDAAYRKELEYFREISDDAEANLKPFSDALQKLKAGDASAVSMVKSADGKSLILTANNIEYTIPAKGVLPADYTKYAEDHVNRILDIKNKSMGVTVEIETLIEAAKKQKYFDGNQYRELKDKMADLTRELNGVPRVSNTQRLEKLKNAKDLEKGVVKPVQFRSLDGPSGTVDDLENVAGNTANGTGNPQAGMITAPKKGFTVETRKNVKTVHGTVEGEFDMKSFEAQKNDAYLVVPDDKTKIGRMAKKLNERDDTQILFSDKTLSQEQSMGTVGNRKFIAYDNVVYKRNSMMIKSSHLTMHEQQVVRSHEAFHVRMMTWVKEGKETPYNSFFRALGKKELRAPFSVYSGEMASEEVHAYAKDFVNATIKANNKQTTQLIESQVKSMDDGLSRIEKLDKVQISYKTVTDPKDFKFRYESVLGVTKSHLENVEHFEENIKLWFKGEADNVKVLKLGEDGFVKVEVEGVEMNFTSVPFDAMQSNDALEKYLIGQTTKMKEIDKAVIENVNTVNAVQAAAKKRGYYTGTEYYDLKNKMGKIGTVVDVNGWVPTADRLK